jgi:hypothetical protein
VVLVGSLLATEVILEVSGPESGDPTTVIVTKTILWSAGQRTLGDAVIGTNTVTVKLHAALLPDASVATLDTVVVPIGKAEPEGGLLTTFTPEALSDAPTTKFTIAVVWPGSVGTVMLAGHVIFGASVSTTLTEKLPVVEFPAVSVATLETVVVPMGKAEPEAGLLTTVTPGVLSVAVTVKFTVAVALPGSVEAVMLAGSVSFGASVSATVTRKVAVAVVPAWSVATLVTVVVPTEKAEPEAGLDTTVTPGQLSVAVTTKFTVAVGLPGSVVAVMLAGGVTLGASVSRTVTENVQVPILPASSVAWHSTSVTPFWNTDPEGGVHTKVMTWFVSIAVVG